MALAVREGEGEGGTEGGRAGAGNEARLQNLKSHSGDIFSPAGFGNIKVPWRGSIVSPKHSYDLGTNCSN